MGAAAAGFNPPARMGMQAVSCPVNCHFQDNTHMSEPKDIAALRLQLHELQVEHRDLDEIIARLLQTPPRDDLLLRRLKKRKLQLKDRIALIERMIEPDVPA
jgi:hypothetical protein